MPVSQNSFHNLTVLQYFTIISIWASLSDVHNSVVTLSSFIFCRSALCKILEGDDIAAKTMVLVVSDVSRKDNLVCILPYLHHRYRYSKADPNLMSISGGIAKTCHR